MTTLFRMTIHHPTLNIPTVFNHYFVIMKVWRSQCITQRQVTHLEQFGVVIDRFCVIRNGLALLGQHDVILGLLMSLAADEHDPTVLARLHQDRDQVSHDQKVSQVIHLLYRKYQQQVVINNMLKLTICLINNYVVTNDIL